MNINQKLRKIDKQLSKIASEQGAKDYRKMNAQEKETFLIQKFTKLESLVRSVWTPKQMEEHNTPWRA